MSSSKFNALNSENYRTKVDINVKNAKRKRKFSEQTLLNFTTCTPFLLPDARRNEWPNLRLLIIFCAHRFYFLPLFGYFQKGHSLGKWRNKGLFW